MKKEPKLPIYNKNGGNIYEWILDSCAEVRKKEKPVRVESSFFKRKKTNSLGLRALPNKHDKSAGKNPSNVDGNDGYRGLVKIKLL